MGGSNSKVSFLKLIENLLEKEVSADDHEFWDELWKTIITPEDLFETIYPDHIRKLIEKHPDNMKTIFTQAVAQLYQLVETPYPVYFEQALNCSRVLSRILPVLLEYTSNSIHQENGQLCKSMRELLWNKRSVKNIQTITNDEGEVVDQKEEVQESEPLAVILVNTIFHLLFLPDLTVEDISEEFNESDVDTPAFKAALMWNEGLGSPNKTISHSSHDNLYQTADNFNSCQSLWLEVATSADAPYAEIVFYSLMNTVLGYDPVGWGIPYGNLVTTDTAKQVMEYSIHSLLILLDYGYPIYYGSANSTNNNLIINGVQYVTAEDTQARGFNIFRKFLGNIESPDELNFLYKGFVRLLNNVHKADSTYLPYSITKIGIEEELLILFWKCIEEIPLFMSYILRHCDINEILVPITYFMLEGRKEHNKVGLIYLCTFTLLKLSGERAFGVSLNKSYQLRLPVELPLFQGNHADLLIIMLHKMIVSGLDKLSALYSCFLTIICNISPYTKSLTNISAIKLVNLLQLFCQPKFLYANEGNHIYVTLLLETFTNIIQYQYEGNGNIIFAIIRRKEIFETLAHLNVNSAIKQATELFMPHTKLVTAGEDKKPAVDQTTNKHSKVIGKDNKLSKVPGDQKGTDHKTNNKSKKSKDKYMNDNSQHHDHISGNVQPTDYISTEHHIVDHSVAHETNKATIPQNNKNDTEESTQSPPEALATANNNNTNTNNTTDDQIDADQTSVEKSPVHEDVATSHAKESKVSSTSTVPPPKNNNTNTNTNNNPAAGLRFLPNEQWLRALKAEIPMTTIMRLLKYLVPQVEEMSSSEVVDEKQVIDFLKTTTMVGLLPVPHPIVIRKYTPNKFTYLWFTAFQWGVIFMHNQGIPLFDGEHVKLFIVQGGNE